MHADISRYKTIDSFTDRYINRVIISGHYKSSVTADGILNLKRQILAKCTQCTSIQGRSLK